MQAQMKTHNEFRTRILDQEPDAIALIPGFRDLIVIGTYSLIETHDDAKQNSRKGSLQLLSFDASHTEPQSFERIDFQFGIYDIQLHPQHPELLGVATSDAQILFFIIQHKADTKGNSSEVSFIKLGEILVEECRESDNQLAIITQFRFINIPTQHPDKTTVQSTRNVSWNILLTATTQFGNTKLIKVEIPLPQETIQGSSGVNSSEASTVSESIQYQIVNVHKQAFDLEAWTTLPILYQIAPSPSQHLLLLSGGDDDQLLTSHTTIPLPDVSEIDLDLVEVDLLLTLKREHQAGIVNICDLGPLISRTSSDDHHENNTTRTQLILTGSYDECLRLFLLSIDHTGQDSVTTSPLCSVKLLSEMNLGGGVWKIKKLDEYSIPLSLSSSATSTKDDITSAGTQIHYILLIAGHTSGGHIVRLTVTPPGISDIGYKHEFNIEKSFVEGHESLVYAVEARQAKQVVETGDIELEDDGHWEVISTSFYDKKICNWNWVDEKRKYAERQQ